MPVPERADAAVARRARSARGAGTQPRRGVEGPSEWFPLNTAQRTGHTTSAAASYPSLTYKIGVHPGTLAHRETVSADAYHFRGR